MSRPTDEPADDYLPEPIPEPIPEVTVEKTVETVPHTAGLPDDLADVRDSFTIWAEDESGWDAITTAARISYVVAFLAWATRDPDVGDPFADEQARDRAVGFYKRYLFQQGRTPSMIDAVLVGLACLYSWAGLGAHNVAYLLSEASEPTPEPEVEPTPEAETASVSQPTPQPTPQRTPDDPGGGGQPGDTADGPADGTAVDG